MENVNKELYEDMEKIYISLYDNMCSEYEDILNNHIEFLEQHQEEISKEYRKILG